MAASVRDGLAVPDPGCARTVEDLVEVLRALRIWAGSPSHEVIRKRVNAAWTADGRPAGELARKTTVVDCFRAGRRRLNADLVLAIVAALHPDDGYVAQWRQALRVVGGETAAAAQVRAQDTLPADLADFTGRTGELDQLRRFPRRGAVADGGPVVISAIEGMAGVGKTQLAIHAGHLLAAEEPFDQVLFVDLRGFHPDPDQPPADPAAVLDAFLRLLGVPGPQIPHDLTARAAAYRRRLAGTRALVVLDNAATEEQVRPLLPDTAGCLTLVTSRRSLTGLPSATHLSVDVFTPDEAVEFLKRAAPAVPTGDDPDAPGRVTDRCGYLPLALGVIAGHIRARPDWTLTDHADRLDERHHAHRLDTGVHLALEVSYRHLPADRARLLRLLTLHPGTDLDGYAAAALAGADPERVGGHLEHLCAEHLLRQATPGRFVLHDLVRGYAAGRATDEDRPAARRAALTRLFDHYLHAAATAMDTLHPAERHRRPRIPPPETPGPAMTDPAAALAWLDAERANLTTVADRAADGWPEHTTRLAATLYRYLLAGGYYRAAEALNTRAREAAHRTGDRAAEAQAISNLGAVCLTLDRYPEAADHLQQAITLCRDIGDRAGEARALDNLGAVCLLLDRHQQAADHHRQAITRFREIDDRYGEARALEHLGILHWRLGRYRQAVDHHHQTITLYREIGDRHGEAYALTNLGSIHRRLGRYQQAADHHRQAIALCRETGDRYGEAYARDNLGTVHERLGDYRRAVDHHQQALTVYREVGSRYGEAFALDNLGTAHRRLGHYRRAADHHRRALTVWRQIGERAGQAASLNSLGETLHAGGRPDDATVPHATALTLATDIGDPYEQARAHHGLADAHHATGEPDLARQHRQHALTLFTELGVPEADDVRAELTALDP